MTGDSEIGPNRGKTLCNHTTKLGAMDFVPMIGRWVLMQRPINDEVESLEARASGMDPDKAHYGGEGALVSLDDIEVVAGKAIEFIMLNKWNCLARYVLVVEEYDAWKFSVWADQVTRLRLQNGGAQLG